MTATQQKVRFSQGVEDLLKLDLLRSFDDSPPSDTKRFVLTKTAGGLMAAGVIKISEDSATLSERDSYQTIAAYAVGKRLGFFTEEDLDKYDAACEVLAGFLKLEVEAGRKPVGL